MTDLPATPLPARALKDALRRGALARRGEIPLETRIEKSLDLAAYADRLDLPAGAVVSGFWPIRDEIDPRPLMSAIRSRGHRLCLPVVQKPALIFRELLPETPLQSAGFGLHEPGPEAAELEPNVLLVPLAAFDARGHRIGYGAGYYDRTIATLQVKKPLMLIGVAFSAQEIDRVPDEPHDRPLHWLLTENGLRRCAGQEPLPDMDTKEKA